MAAILMMLLSIFLGYHIVSRVLSGYFEKFNVPGWMVTVPGWMVILPASFLTGTLLLSWSTYILSYPFYKTTNPLLYGNLISVILMLIAAAVVIIHNRYPDRISESLKRLSLSKINSCISKYRLEIIYIIVVTVFWTYFMYRSFHVRDGLIRVGFSVFSDFAPHLAVIRSFSYGSNFPTEYPHFADGTIRYHFLFQFLAGNLEYLGLRLDHAFNIPSVLSMVSFLMLIYSLAVMITGKKQVGIITVLLFHFRSSFAFFTHISKFDSVNGFLRHLSSNTTHIGNTRHEDWGLWAQKVFVNQRHLSAGIGVLLLLFIIMLPLLNEMLNSIKKVPFRRFIHEFALCGEAWVSRDIGPSIFAGVLLGLTGFLNGAAVIATLSVLFVMALFSRQRLAFLNIAVISLILVFIHVSFFVRDNSRIPSPMLTVGFLADGKDIGSIARYFTELLGILPLVLLAALLTSSQKLMSCALPAIAASLPYSFIWLAPEFSSIYKIIIIVILLSATSLAVVYGLRTGPAGIPAILIVSISPVILAILLRVTPDITVNHKYVIIGVLLLNIIVASFLYTLLSSRRTAAIISALLLFIPLTITGAVDITTLYNLDRNHVEIRIDDPLTVWATENTGPNEVFLTYKYSLHPLLLSGRKVFYGWPYYAWSAGYDTSYRDSIVKKIYSAANADTLKALVMGHNISYIVVENDNRNTDEYRLNEKLVEETFEQVYVNGDYRIFRTY
jgi:hypothetical protein